MNGRGRPSAAQPPRALLLATGEQVPQGQSIRARLLIVEVKPGDVNRGGAERVSVGRRSGLLGSIDEWLRQLDSQTVRGTATATP